MESFHYTFQISKKIIFEVNYYLLGSNKSKYFSTSAAEFNQPKTDFYCCGQAQNELLKGFPLAMNFYKKFEQFHCKDLTEEQYKEILFEIEKLKSAYNFIHTENDRGFSYGSQRELSMLKVKKS